LPQTSGVTRTVGIQRTLALILVLNALVVGVKFAVALRTGNLTVLGAALESFLDAMNNVLAIVVVALAARGPDEDHPYGHDKFETMGALAIVGFLSISCFELVRGAVARLANPPELTVPGTLELVLLGSTAVVNVIVVAYERRKAREYRSPILYADATHTLGDLFVTGLALASLIAARFGAYRADPILAIVVAALIAWSGWQILRVTVPVLVDERGADADRIRSAALAVPGVMGVRTVRSRTNSSGFVFAEVTVTVSGKATVADGHAIADAVEAAVADALGGEGDVVVHVEPS
jgi:cation diffusion facilitator family transporter